MAKKTKRKVAYRRLPMQPQLNLHQEGRHFDLGAIFDQLNRRYFRGQLRNYKVMWGRRRKHRPKDHFVFGTIQEEDRVIRIHPLLDQAFVPRWYLKYVLYHEMLHSVVPDKTLRQWKTTGSHRRIQSPRTRISQLLSRTSLGRSEPRAISPVIQQSDSYRLSAAAGRELVSDGEGVVATFFLMRYQSVVARSRDINFARQFFRSSFFITSVQ